MATRSKIAIRKIDGKVESIYCHWDGYPTHNGKILKDFYKTPERVQELIDLGNISSLGQFIKPHPEMEHSFDMPQPNTTVAYERDRHEEGQEKHVFNYESAFLKDCLLSDCEFYYLYDEKTKEWYFSAIPYVYDILEPTLLTDEIVNE